MGHMEKFIETITLVQMPEDATYGSVEEIVAKAKTNQVTGHLCLGSHAANEGEELAEGVLVQNSLEFQPTIDLSGLIISSLRLKRNFLGNIDLVTNAGLTTLKILDVSECELETLGDGIKLLVNLEELDVSENNLTEIPAAIGECTKLTFLSAFKNKLKKIPAEIGQCTALEEVNFFNNKLMDSGLPASMAELSSLTDLNLGGNKLKTIPCTDKWTEMTKLSIHQNNLMNNPEFRKVLPSFEKMTKLEFLKMDMNKMLSHLPYFGTGMAQLEHFECNGCAIQSLAKNHAGAHPDGNGSEDGATGIDSWTNIKTFNCQNQKGEGLKETIDISNIAATLDTFNIEGNKDITALPAGIEKCEQLRVLFFQGTGVTSIQDFSVMEAGADGMTLARFMYPSGCALTDKQESGIKASCDVAREINGKQQKGMMRKF